MSRMKTTDLIATQTPLQNSSHYDSIRQQLLQKTTEIILTDANYKSNTTGLL